MMFPAQQGKNMLGYIPCKRNEKVCKRSEKEIQACAA